jgi:amidase
LLRSYAIVSGNLGLSNLPNKINSDLIESYSPIESDANMKPLPMALLFCLMNSSTQIYASNEIDHDQLHTLEKKLKQKKITAVELLQTYEARITQLNPQIGAVIAINPGAMQAAIAADQSVKHKGALSGLPILVKDNIDVKGMVTSAGSLALAENLRTTDAPLVARLRNAGAIIVGKTNLSEWANLRSSKSTSGWSSLGGQTHNPYDIGRSPCGSSSGSGAAVAARMIPAAIGTETDGSVVCPASANGLVGLKPTIGLVSRTGIVPLSHSQDTAGPMTLSVRDAAMLLNAMAGSDPADPATVKADLHRAHNYVANLKTNALKGKRLGVVSKLLEGYDVESKALFEQTLAILRSQGATIVDMVEIPHLDELEKDELTLLLYEFKADLNLYLTTTPDIVKNRTMAEVIQFNITNANKVMPYFGQDLMEQAQATAGLDDPKYKEISERLKRLAGPEGIDAALKKYKLDALIAPTNSPAWVIDYPIGDVVGASASTPAAVAGYPHLTVPMGLVHGTPVGVSFFAGAWSEAKLLGLGYAFEQARAPLPKPSILSIPR